MQCDFSYLILSSVQKMAFEPFKVQCSSTYYDFSLC